ncbi:MAG: chalcone isomerase family protein [Bdellovibrionaceae bacterium]|nr:chalcone isomerase family protein [Pseudobdellovibrionaceae bacterium]
MMILSWLLPTVVSAAILTGQPGAPSTIFEWQKEKTPLTLAGQGRRLKKVAFISVKVYDASFYVADAAAFKRTAAEALDSTDQQKRFAMVLKFLRDVPAERVIGSFKEALTANKIDLEGPGVKEFLKTVEVGGEVKGGQTLTLIGLRDPQGETLLFENGQSQVATIKGTTGFLKQILSIWFGQTTESTMADLKNSLLKQP